LWQFVPQHGTQTLAPHPLFEHKHAELGPHWLELLHGVTQLQKMFWKLAQTPSVLRLLKQPRPPVQDPDEHPGDPLRAGAHPLQVPPLHPPPPPDAAKAEGSMLVTTGAVQAIAAPAPILLSILRREMPSF
jgi:hypothetical protein